MRHNVTYIFQKITLTDGWKEMDCLSPGMNTGHNYGGQVRYSGLDQAGGNGPGAKRTVSNVILEVVNCMLKHEY